MDGKNDKKKEIIVRIVCVILSFGLWLYVMIMQNPIKELKLTNVPVEILNSDVLKDSKLVLSPNQEFYVNLSLQGPVSEIYKVTKEQFKITADLGAYALKKGDNKIRVDIKQSPSTISIKNNSYLTIDVRLDEYVEKTIPIRGDISITTKQGFYAEAPKLTPNNAIISGPEEYVNRVKELIVSEEIKNSGENIRISLPIKPIDENNKVVNYINVSPANSEVSIVVNKSKNIPVNIAYSGNLPDSFVLKSITSTPQNIEVLGDEATLENLKQIWTEVIDLSKIKENKEVVVKLLLPDKVRTVDNSTTVNVSIEITKLVTRELEIPIVFKGLSDGLEATSDTEKVKVILNGNEEDINSIKAEDITSEIDLTGANEGEGQYSVQVNYPSNKVKLTSILPDKIKVKITKK